MLEFCEVSKTFKSDLFKTPFKALDKVSFSLPAGKTIGFLGANGAGKTTSLKLAMDFIRPDSGKINFSEKLGHSRSEVFSKIGFLPERPFFYPHLTGTEFCLYMGKLSGLNRKEIKQNFNYWAPRFKIDFALERQIRTYSKGMLQRIGFLVTLLHNPELIILDEPLSGVDPIGRKELKDVMSEINKEGKTLFFSSHIVSDMQEVCSHVVCLREGKMIFEGEINDLVSQNSSLNVTISYYEANQLAKIQVKQENINEVISQLISSGKTINEVVMDRPTLEEIFYEEKA